MQVVDTAASATMGRLLVLVGALALGVVIAVALSLLLG